MSTHSHIELILETGVEVAGEILNISHVGMRVRVPVRFAEGAVLGFRVHDCPAQGQVLHCHPDGDRFILALSVTGDRRREPRFAVNEPVSVGTVSGMGAGKHHRGRLIDVSQSGVGIITGFPFEAGSLVEVCADSGVLYGEIRSCVRLPDGQYRLGILAEEIFAGDLREKHVAAWKGTLKTCASRIRAGFGGHFGKQAGPELNPETPAARP